MNVRIMLLCGLVSLLTALGGCSNKVTVKSIRKDPSPALDALARSKEQRKNDWTRIVDTNKRQIWDDIDYLLLLDRPSRSSRYPVP